MTHNAQTVKWEGIRSRAYDLECMIIARHDTIRISTINKRWNVFDHYRINTIVTELYDLLGFNNDHFNDPCTFYGK